MKTYVSNALNDFVLFEAIERKDPSALGQGRVGVELCWDGN